MVEARKPELTGEFQQGHQGRSRLTEFGPRLSLSPPRRSLSACGERSTADADVDQPTSSRNFDTLELESQIRLTPRYMTNPPTSSLYLEDLPVDGIPSPPLAGLTTRSASRAGSVTGDEPQRPANNVVAYPGPRYAPPVDTISLTRMFAPPNAGLPPSYHSIANSSLRGDYGDHVYDAAPPEYDWETAMDVENMVEEEQPPTQATTTPQEQLPGPSQEAPRRAHYYRGISAEIMADFDFPMPAPKAAPSATGTPDSFASSPPRRRGYLLPTPASILADIDIAPFSPQTTGGSTSTAASTPPMQSPHERPRSNSKLASLSPNNPYMALLELKEQAMTVAFLRSQDSGSGSRSADLGADDFSFGQRYQKAPDTTDVVVTRQRLPVNDLGGSRECPICAETRDPSAFPILSITPTCTHPPEACLECLQMSIKSDFNSKLWTDIRCPECRELLEYVDIQKYADEETFARYEALALRAAMAEADKFIWCTANCGSGQLHDAGGDQPILTCLHCGQRSCFAHNVAWHENLSCEEYDALLRDPENFRSRIEMEYDELDSARQALEDADRAMAQGLMAEQQAEIHERESREREERERARKAAALARKVAARRKTEEEQSRVTVSRTTKPCPGCGWAIEKNSGCSHITCIKCRFEFCWGCYTTWEQTHSVRCRGPVPPA